MTASKHQDRVIGFVTGVAVGVAIGLFIWPGSAVIGALWFATVPATLAFLSYLTLGAWTKTTLGRVLLALMATVSGLLVLVLVNSAVGRYAGRQEVTEVALLIAGVVQWAWLSYLLLAVIRGPRRNRAVAWRKRRLDKRTDNHA